jgi:hypothetical protein
LKNEILKNEILKEEENRILLCESRFCLFLHAKFFREIKIERIYKKIHIEKNRENREFSCGLLRVIKSY